MSRGMKIFLGGLGFLTLISIGMGNSDPNFEERAVAEAVTYAKEAARAEAVATTVPKYTGDCPVYGVTINEPTSLYFDKTLVTDRRKKGFVPAGTKLCFTAQHRPNPAYMTYQFTLNGQTGWTSQFNLEGSGVSIEPGAGDAVSAMRRAQAESSSADARLVSQRKSRVRERCEDAARQSAAMPDTARLSVKFISDWPGHDNGVILKGTVSARNAFNVPDSANIECMLDNSGFSYNVF